MAKLALPFPIPRDWSPAAAEAIETNFRRLFGSSGRLGSGGTTLTNGLDLLDPVVGDIIACVNSAGTFDIVAIVTTNQRAIVNTGGIPTWGQIDLTAGVTGDLPLSNLAPASATQRVLGRNSASGGDWEEVTLSQLLDWIGSAAQGDILFRGSAGWQRLAAGTAGQLLQTGGASADPSYVTAGGGVANNIINQQYYELHGRPTTLERVGIGAPATAGTIGTTQINYAAGSTVQFIQTGTTGGLRAGFDSSRFDLHESDSDMTWEIVLYTGAQMANTRIFMGLGAAGFSVNADDQGGATNYMMFRYSTVAGDGGWVGACRDGSTQSVTATVASIGASTRYKLKIRKSGSTVFFSVNGGAETSHSSNLPAAATALGFSCHVFNSSNSTTHPWEFSRLRCYYGS